MTCCDLACWVCFDGSFGVSSCLDFRIILSVPLWVMSDRDWKAYNAALVKRGEILLDLRIVKGWRGELVEMNRGEGGAQYEYPGSFIKMVARYADGLKAPDYSSMAWRIQRLDVKLNDPLAKSNDEVVLAVDASGVKVANRGEWMRHKWKVRRGWLKIHIAAGCEVETHLGYGGVKGEG